MCSMLQCPWKSLSSFSTDVDLVFSSLISLPALHSYLVVVLMCHFCLVLIRKIPVLISHTTTVAGMFKARARSRRLPPTGCIAQELFELPEPERRPYV